MPDSELENQGPSSQTCSSPYAFAGGYRDTFSVVESDEIYYVERDGVSEREMPSYSVDTSLAEANSNYPTVCGDSLNSSMWKGENDSQIKHIGDDVESERMQNLHWLIIIFRYLHFHHSFKPYFTSLSHQSDYLFSLQMLHTALSLRMLMELLKILEQL